MVQDSDDRVIHKNYNAEYIRTEEARRAHLERLNSMPNIKVDTELFYLSNKDTCPTKHKLLPLDEVDDDPNAYDMSSSCYSFQSAKQALNKDNVNLHAHGKVTILEMQESRPLLRISDQVTAASHLEGSFL